MKFNQNSCFFILAKDKSEAEGCLLSTTLKNVLNVLRFWGLFFCFCSYIYHWTAPCVCVVGYKFSLVSGYAGWISLCLWREEKTKLSITSIFYLQNPEEFQNWLRNVFNWRFVRIHWCNTRFKNKFCPIQKLTSNFYSQFAYIPLSYKQGCVVCLLTLEN